MEVNEPNKKPSDNSSPNGDYDQEFPITEEEVSYENIEDEALEDDAESKRLLQRLGVQTRKLEKIISDFLRKLRDTGTDT